MLSSSDLAASALTPSASREIALSRIHSRRVRRVFPAHVCNSTRRIFPSSVPRSDAFASPLVRARVLSTIPFLSSPVRRASTRTPTPHHPLASAITASSFERLHSHPALPSHRKINSYKISLPRRFKESSSLSPLPPAPTHPSPPPAVAISTDCSGSQYYPPPLHPSPSSDAAEELAGTEFSRSFVSRRFPSTFSNGGGREGEMFRDVHGFRYEEEAGRSKVGRGARRSRCRGGRDSRATNRPERGGNARETRISQTLTLLNQ